MPVGMTQQFLVRQWYNLYLHREPDPLAEVWMCQLQEGQPPNAVLSSILASDEYYNLAGATPEGYVSRLMLDLHGNVLDWREVRSYAVWVQQAGLGMEGRKQVAWEVLCRMEKKL